MPMTGIIMAEAAAINPVMGLLSEKSDQSARRLVIFSAFF